MSEIPAGAAKGTSVSTGVLEAALVEGLGADYRTSLTDLGAVTARIVRGATRITGSRKASVWLPARGGGDLVCVAASLEDGVTSGDGLRIPADVVVLNPDLPVAHRDLLGREPWGVRRLTYSPSCYLLLAGLSTGTQARSSARADGPAPRPA